MLATAHWTLAHQGGWDELLMFGLPIVLAVFAVRWAEKRGKAKRAESPKVAAAVDQTKEVGTAEDAGQS